MTLTVTVRDNETGDEETQRVEDGDYLMITTEPAHVSSIQVYRRGATHVITVKDRIVVEERSSR